MIRDCCAGVAFLHSKGLMHCDIKSLNFLVTNEFVVKLSDLGEARPFKGMTAMDRGKMPKYLLPFLPLLFSSSPGLVLGISIGQHQRSWSTMETLFVSSQMSGHWLWLLQKY
jgi:serine/threonine protein kinase